MIPENHDNHPPGPSAGADDLERLLARHVFRQPPPEWREAILEQANAAAEEATARAPVPSSPASAPRWFAFLDRLTSGWSPIAAAWLLALGLNQYAAQPVTAPGLTYPPLSETSLAELQADRAELRDLANLTAPVPAPESTPNPVSRPPAGTPTRPRAQLPAPAQSLACVPHLHPLLV
jgi:hypothetical protein